MRSYVVGKRHRRRTGESRVVGKVTVDVRPVVVVERRRQRHHVDWVASHVVVVEPRGRQRRRVSRC